MHRFKNKILHAITLWYGLESCADLNRRKYVYIQRLIHIVLNVFDIFSHVKTVVRLIRMTRILARTLGRPQCVRLCQNILCNLSSLLRDMFDTCLISPTSPRNFENTFASFLFSCSSLLFSTRRELFYSFI